MTTMPSEADGTEAEVLWNSPTATAGVGVTVSTAGVGVVVGGPAVAAGAEMAAGGAATAAIGGVMVMNSSKNKSDGYERGRTNKSSEITFRQGRGDKARTVTKKYLKDIEKPNFVQMTCLCFIMERIKYHQIEMAIMVVFGRWQRKNRNWKIVLYEWVLMMKI